MLEKQDLELIAGVMTKALEPVIERLDRVETGMANLGTAVERLEARGSSLEARVTELEARMGTMEQDVRGLRFLMESDVRCDIRTIAEGHLDLSRKLDEAILTKDERELIFLRLSVLENDIRILKEQRA